MEGSARVTSASDSYLQAFSHGEGSRARAVGTAQCWEQTTASQEKCGGVSAVEVCQVCGMCIARGGGRQECGWQLAHSHLPGVGPHHAFSCLWQSQGNRERVLPGPPTSSCWQSPSAAALPVLRNVILSMKIQHDVLVSYNLLNPSQASALWGFRCKL